MMGLYINGAVVQCMACMSCTGTRSNHSAGWLKCITGSWAYWPMQWFGLLGAKLFSSCEFASHQTQIIPMPAAVRAIEAYSHQIDVLRCVRSNEMRKIKQGFASHWVILTNVNVLTFPWVVIAGSDNIDRYIQKYKLKRQEMSMQQSQAWWWCSLFLAISAGSSDWRVLLLSVGWPSIAWLKGVGNLFGLYC